MCPGNAAVLKLRHKKCEAQSINSVLRKFSPGSDYFFSSFSTNCRIAEICFVVG